MNRNLRDWYMSAFPTDELGERLNANITLEGVLESLKKGEDIYDFIGVGDSIVRERIFTEIADATGCEYDDIYLLWKDGQKD